MASLFIQKSINLGELLKKDSLRAEAFINLSNYLAVFDGDYDSSLFAIQKSIEILTTSGNRSKLLAIAYRIEGITYYDLSEFHKSSNSYKKALSVLDELDYLNRGERAKLLNNLANAYDGLGFYDKALKIKERTLELKKVLYPFDHIEVAMSYNNLGNSFSNIGQYEKAIEYFEQSMRIKIKNDGYESASVASTLNNIGNAYFDTGKFLESISTHREALRIRKRVFPPQHPILLYSFFNLARAYPEVGKNDSALYYSNLAIKVLNKNYEKPNYFTILIYINHASYLLNSGEHNQAKILLSDALSLAVNIFGPKHPILGVLYNGMYKLYLEVQNNEEALKSLNLALNSISFKEKSTGEFNVLDNALYLNLLATKAELMLNNARQSGYSVEDLTEIRQELITADLFIAENRKNFVNQNDFIKLSAESRRVCEAGVEIDFELYTRTNNEIYAEEALILSEKGKSNLLLSRWLSSKALDKALVDREIAHQESLLREQISYLQSQAMNAPESVVIRDSIFRAKEEYELFINQIESKYPKYYELKFKYQFKTLLSDLRRALQSNELLVEFFMKDSDLYVWSLSRLGLNFRRIELDSDFKSTVKSWTTFLQTPKNNAKDSLQGLGYKIFKQTLNPILADIDLADITKITIVPDDVLGSIPFELLNTDAADGYLFEGFSVSYADNGAMLLLKEKKSSGRQIEFLGIAPEYATGFDALSLAKIGRFRNEVVDLVWNRSEVEKIAALMDGNTLTSKEASESNFKKNRNSRIAHFAMHALLDDLEPMNSRLIFSQATDSIEDGFLHAFELYALNINTELAVLSACKTGVGEFYRGEGMMSLARAFTYAGVPSIVMSKWQVDDQSTSQLMQYFYKNLKSGMTKSEALRQAKLEFLETAPPEKQHPFYWGAFVVIGDDSPLFTRSYLWVAPIILIAFLLILVATRHLKRSPGIS